MCSYLALKSTILIRTRLLFQKVLFSNRPIELACISIKNNQKVKLLQSINYGSEFRK